MTTAGVHNGEPGVEDVSKGRARNGQVGDVRVVPPRAPRRPRQRIPMVQSPRAVTLPVGGAILVSADERLARLQSTARDLAESPDVWRPRVCQDTDERWYVPLLADEHCEAWLLGWPVGEGIELHDHGNSSAAVYVVEGTLVETFVDPADRMRPGGVPHERTLPADSLVSFGPDHIHDIVNPGDRLALSIHVYSPRLRSMTFYRHFPEHGLVAVRSQMCEPVALPVSTAV